MPIDWTIDHDRKLVLAWPRETFEEDDLLTYQREVWGKPGVQGYDEIIDMGKATRVLYGSPWKIREMAAVAVESDVQGLRTKMAIVTTNEQYAELGRMFQAFRELFPKSMKEVQLFATRAEALKWLGKGGDPVAPGKSDGP